MFPAESDQYALRIELFGDEIESLKIFDFHSTGHIEKEVPRATIYPKTHYVTPRQQVLDAVEAIKAELRKVSAAS